MSEPPAIPRSYPNLSSPTVEETLLYMLERDPYPVSGPMMSDRIGVGRAMMSKTFTTLKGHGFVMRAKEPAAAAASRGAGMPPKYYKLTVEGKRYAKALGETE